MTMVSPKTVHNDIYCLKRILEMKWDCDRISARNGKFYESERLSKISEHSEDYINFKGKKLLFSS